MPSVGSLEALLRNIGFDEVNVFAVEGQRAVLVCRKKHAYADSRVLGRLTAVLTLEGGETKCSPGAELHFSVSAENTGSVRWLAIGDAITEKGTVRLGAHLFGADEEEVSWDYGRSSMPTDIGPGEVVRFDMALRAPDRPGKYYVEFDLVVEQLAWFENLGSPILRCELDVA